MKLQSEHVAWDTTLGAEIETLRVDASDPGREDVNSQVVSALHRYGFAVLRGLSVEAVCAAHQLRAVGEALGQVTAQSPRGELVEDSDKA